MLNISKFEVTIDTRRQNHRHVLDGITYHNGGTVSNFAQCTIRAGVTSLRETELLRRNLTNNQLASTGTNVLAYRM